MKRGAFILFCIALATLAATVAIMAPTEIPFIPECPFLKTTGFYCAGCGSTRALHALLQGQLLQAFAYNPLTTLFAPFAAYLLLAWGLRVFTKRSLPVPEPRPIFLVALLALIVTFAIVRNIPFEPFTLFAPHEITGAYK